MNYEKRLEDVEKILEKLKLLNGEYAVIVEGKKDEETLRKLCLKGRIIRIRGSISRLCEEISREHKKVIILSDWDKKGGELCRRLKKYLNANTVKYDDRIRAELTEVCKKEIKDVESLITYVENLRRRCKLRNREVFG
ncbi:MAG: DNA primase [Candidatus Thermoplasmatota archaeon]|nr:DNA primase [Candidatus Thermoplasmatota archaeon]